MASVTENEKWNFSWNDTFEFKNHMVEYKKLRNTFKGV